jgi:anhydro-N-acetylmuramic acid kinase
MMQQGSTVKTASSAKAMIVAGVMSGTSADGVDVAICRVSLGRSGVAPVKVLGHSKFAYGKKLRAMVMAAAGGEKLTAAKLARLSWKLGEEYAACVEKTAKQFKLSPQLVAVHGQTILHDADEGMTWQVGEAAVIAERLRLPVVSDFRPADMAAGGQGAPLVPMLDWHLFSHATKNRLLLNLGGIANITALPADGEVKDTMAFDTGPANMVIDAVMIRLFKKEYDSGGRIAAKGKVLTDVVKKMAAMKYLQAKPPKSCGREEFGEAFVDTLIGLCEKADAAKEDIVATATALTVTTILEAYSKFCWPHLGQIAPGAKATEMFVAGGGAKNKTLMRGLTEKFAALGVKVGTTESAGLAVEAKEAAAFALLGWLTWHGLPGNVPSATGAKRAVVLGKVSYGG